MSTFLLIFGLAALLIVGGMRGSLHLRPHHMPTGRRLSGLRRFHAAQSNYTTEDDEMSQRARKALIILILFLIMLSVIIITLHNAVIH